MPLSLTGQLICTTDAQAEIVREYQPEHIRLTRAEPGCELFEVTQGDDPLIWELNERFTTRADFEAHQARTKASDWGRATQGITRDFRIFEG
ncbi:putative quinol monooxygenase [Thioclava pacifica]|uniref:ABM domain-containing protein n=1 Tax=Thioclava pacifica DSM 10166 TaxID=1353537 RepID=A0A074J5G5_9RHOB|nr:antibiotic biosynthesis monooxygenase [Thioclava pacifica]KEO51769.1 hypothetical protein TP2_09835 [Thioclava pacifica DSM 10166]